MKCTEKVLYFNKVSKNKEESIVLKVLWVQKVLSVTSPALKIWEIGNHNNPESYKCLKSKFERARGVRAPTLNIRKIVTLTFLSCLFVPPQLCLIVAQPFALTFARAKREWYSKYTGINNKQEAGTACRAAATYGNFYMIIRPPPE